MCPSKLFIFDEFGGILTQLSAMPKTRTRCADSVVRCYHVYMVKWDLAIGDKVNAEIDRHRRSRSTADRDRSATEIEIDRRSIDRAIAGIDRHTVATVYVVGLLDASPVSVGSCT